MARSETARQPLLEAACEEFGRKGFDAASTRAIAELAGQNIAAINYHFGSKEGLYLAVAEAIATFVEPLLIPELTTIRAYLDGPVHSHADTEAYLARLLRTFGTAVVGTADKVGATLFIMREQSQPTAAFETLYQRFMRPMHETLTRLVALRRGLAPTNVDAILRAHAILSQLLGFRSARGVLLKRINWDAATHPTPEHVERVLAIIVEHSLAAVSAGLTSGAKQ